MKSGDGDNDANKARTDPGGNASLFESLLDGWNRKFATGEARHALETGAIPESRPISDTSEVHCGAPDVAQWVNQLTLESQQLTCRMRALEAELKQLRRMRHEAQDRERARAIAAVSEMLGLLSIPRRAVMEAIVGERTAVVGSVTHETGPALPAHTTYRGPNGEVWMGRGRYPKWLKALLDAGGRLGDIACTDEER